MNNKTAYFLMPRSSRAWNGAEALWVTVAGWAAAAEQHWGSAWIGTADTVATAAEVLHYPLGNKTAGVAKKSSINNLVPLTAKTLLKDVRLYRQQPKTWAIEKPGVWQQQEVQLVWEQHDLFPGPGYAMAKKHKVPFVLYVHGPAVWEAAKWGVKRPVWGNWIENNIEAVSLKRADAVLCVTEEVRRKVIEMGVQENKTLICPMSVDTSLFNPQKDSSPIRKKFGLENKVVIGWTGSFRSFHGLDTVVKAFNTVKAQHPNAVLLLVGDGFEKPAIEALVQNMNLQADVIFAGKQPFASVPDYVAAFDIALVSASSAEGFHYSPLKLREYLAAGKAAIAPRAGDLPLEFRDGHHLLFYEAGDIQNLGANILKLVENQELRKNLGANAVEYITAQGTWLSELKKLNKLLGIE